MCGIVGVVGSLNSNVGLALPELVDRMAALLAHRGPDDSGVWTDSGGDVALGSRRLSVIDLSHAGHQPMVSASGRYVVTYNGEIYNYREVRVEVEHHDPAIRWRGHSDTEVLLAAIERWGVPRTVEKLTGMFAFGVWDRRERMLHLARDRLGEKPLYYGWIDGAFVFASELKAFQGHPRWQGSIDRGVLALFLRHSCIPAPHCIYQNVYKLAPGTLLSVNADRAGLREELRPTRYWALANVVQSSREDDRKLPWQARMNELDALLRTAIKGQMISDVPIGAFLSGGIDSSTVVSVMQTQSSKPVRTFTVAFYEAAYSEADHARAVARHLGTDHTELYLTPADAIALIPKLPSIYDEPFADASQIPTFFVAELARRQVKVSLSGDGGDELFGGYNRYLWGRRVMRVLPLAPLSVRLRLANGLRRSLARESGEGANFLGALLPMGEGSDRPRDRLQKLCDILEARSPGDIYQSFTSHWRQGDVVLGANVAAPAPFEWGSLPNATEQMMFNDTTWYLPDDILVKLDRAAMAVSLETRTPFLDHKIVEFAWRIPLGLKLRHGKGKWLLRQLLYSYVPKKLVERPKMGFEVPIGRWLRGPLKEWAAELLSAEKFRQQGYFDPAPILKKWNEHVAGTHNWQFHLWDVLMFQAWLESSKA